MDDIQQLPPTAPGIEQARVEQGRDVERPRGGGVPGRRFVLRPAAPAPPPPPLDADQRAVVEHALGAAPRSALVLGGPGTGKTTTAVELVGARAGGTRDGLRRVLVLCHGRSAAHDLRSRLVRRLGSTQTGTSVMTVHGFCLALMRRFGDIWTGGAEVRLLTAPEQDFRIRELLAGHDTDAWPTDLAQAASTRGLAGEMRAALARARQLGLDPDALRAIGVHTGQPAWSAVGGFFDEYLDVMDAEGVLDYAELVHRARLLLLEPGVREALAAEHDLVVVDEFAECDASQRHLVGDLAGIGLDLVAFADPSTRVFGFRGADPRGVLDLPDEVQVTGADRVPGPLPVLSLTHDHRHPAEVAEVLARVAARLPRGDRAPASTVTRAPDARPRAQALVFESAGAEADHIAEILRSAHVGRDGRGGLDWPEMAVICRTGRSSLPALSRALTAAGVPVEVAGDDMPLADEQAVRPLVLGLDLAGALARGERLEPDAVLRLLRSPIGGLDSLALRRLARGLRRARAAELSGALPPPSEQLVAEFVLQSPHQAARDTASGVAPGTDCAGADPMPDPYDPMPDPYEPPPDDECDVPPPDDRLTDRFDAADIDLDTGADDDTDAVLDVTQGADAAAARAVGVLLQKVSRVVAKGATAHVALWELWDGSPWPERLRRDALGGGDASRRAHRDLDAVVALFDLAARQQHLFGDRGVRALLDEIASQSIAADTMRESNVRNRGVRLLTAHRAKGQQWALVVLAGVQEGTWPVLGRRGRLLDPDELEPQRHIEQGLLPTTTNAAVLADERRLFLLAASRATERLVVTASAGIEGEGNQPSRFLRDLGVDITEVGGRPQRATTLAGLSAELRRVAVDPQSPPALRQAAAQRLARLADARDRHGNPLARAADPAAWWGMDDLTPGVRPVARRDATVELSGSSLESILRCPRQWFLSRRAHADAGHTQAQSLGSLLHVLVEHAVSDDLALATLTEHLERIWDDVRFDAQWLAATERGEAEAALERFVAWHEAHRGRRVVGVEVPFRHTIEVDGQPVVLQGSVDRLDRDGDGRLRIIDFKTGRSVPTAAAAAASDQMGLYQLAAASGAFDAVAPGVREVAGADLVYLRKQDGRGAPFPKVFTQPSLTDHPHSMTLAKPTSQVDPVVRPNPAAPGDPRAGDGDSTATVDDTSGADAGHGERPTWVHDRIAAAADIIRSERFDAVRNPNCQFCPFQIGCPVGGEELVS